MKLWEYKNQVKEDVLNFAEEMKGYVHNMDQFRDECFISDSVTGNGSGSYYCNSGKAEEAIGELIWSEELLDIFKMLGENRVPLEKGAEHIDVSIRCFLVDEVISDNEEEIKEILFAELEEKED